MQRTTDFHPVHTGYARFNKRVAVAVTDFVGSMTCAYLFAGVALVSLPAAIVSHNVITIISWIAQTFLQLVLLSVILVGSNLSAAAADTRAEQQFRDTEEMKTMLTGISRSLGYHDSGVKE